LHSAYRRYAFAGLAPLEVAGKRAHHSAFKARAKRIVGAGRELLERLAR
jgi:hypothetical protein